MSNYFNGLHKQELASHSPNNHVYKYKKNFRFYPKVQKFGADDKIHAFEPLAITSVRLEEIISTYSFHQKSHS